MTSCDNLEATLAESIRQAQIQRGAMTGLGGASSQLPAPLATAIATAATHTGNGSAPDVYRAINKISKVLSRDGIGKGRKNEQQSYSFRGIDDVMNALSALLAGAELLILPRMKSRVQVERRTAADKPLFYVTVEADFDFVSVVDGSHHVVTMYGEAMDSADKATNKAMSAAYKYACLQVFCIPTEGMADADATTPEPKAAPKVTQPAPRELTIVPDQPKKAWSNKGECKRAFLKLRDQLGSVVFEEELGRFSLSTADVTAVNFKSGMQAAEAFQSLILCAERQLGVQ